jgi:hypothetical protein
MCLFFDPYASDDHRRYASRHAYVSSQKPKWAHFPGRRNLFLFSRAPYILRTTYFSDNNACNNCSDAALIVEDVKDSSLTVRRRSRRRVASEYMAFGD